MNAEIIAVGSELLLGQIVNTNARFLSKHLAEIGINVFYHTVVGDNANRLKSTIEIAEQRSDLIIFTGGLGPTKDDLTKETIAKHIGKELVMDEAALTSIEQYFVQVNRQMTDNNRKQALILEDSTVLKNDHGMAPGMLLRTNTHMYMLLPGPPKEMEPMFFNYGLLAIKGQLQSDDRIVSRVLRFFGIGEAALETEIEDLIDSQTNPTIAPLAADGEVTLRLTAKHQSEDTANRLLDEVEEKILSRVGDFFYGYNDTSLISELSKQLKSKNLTIACAESLTGGLFQQELTAIPGSGDLLAGGIVCYTNDVKTKLLQVKESTIQEFGVVSEPCAIELAENVQKLLGSDIGISFTGVAGPDELEGKPVGTVYIGIAINGKPTIAEKLSLAGTRSGIRSRTVKYGSSLLLKSLT
ncbi:competence/damage-inducible protein A [Cytobacillus spongiae]|uniref:competence/damage-inducible protein A n=1 Tax=Cytobacillus spongiae TaxID=2901381 RepID=UPI001F2B919B|nr:competence/damage-inducible protein A [Cytobacillus spongiae]UII57482.1 competence/damage-inducible protein A [Cytobacillus spongiae]